MRWFLPLLLLPRLALAGILESSKEIDGSAVSPSSITITATTGTCLTIGSDGLSVTVDCGAKEVGIGTIDPRSKLDVRGASNLSSTADIFRVSSNTTTDFLLIRNDGSVTIAPNTATSSTFTAAGNLDLASNGDLTITGASGLLTAGSSVTLNGMLRMPSTGDEVIHVGGGAACGAPLCVSNSAANRSFFGYKNSGANRFWIGEVGNSNTMSMYSIDYNTTGLMIDFTTGNVGLGNGTGSTVGRAPATLLHASSGTVTLDGDDPQLRIIGVGSTTNPFVVGVSTLVVLSNGSIGVGTSAPATKLHMSSGTMTIDGNVANGINLIGTNITQGGVALSSFTTSGDLSGTFTATANGTCVAGSTITLNLPTGTSGVVSVLFHGQLENDTLNAEVAVGYLVDGAYVNGQTTAKGITGAQEPVATDGMNLSFSDIATGLAAGAHNFCLTGFVSAGTATIESTTAVARFKAHMMP